MARRVWIGATLAAAAVAMLVAALVRVERDVRDRQVDALTRLAAVMSGPRLLSGRIAGLPYGPLSNARDAGSRSLSVDARYETTGLEKRAQDTGQPFDRAVGAIARLVTGDVEAAVAALEEVTAEDPRHAVWWTNLSAAYLARDEQKTHRADAVLALEAAERALEIDPSFQAALFNKALALEALPVTGEAIKAWAVYVRSDTASAWASEAIDRRTKLEAAAARARAPLVAGATEQEVAAASQAAREYLEETLVPRWAEAYARADAAAQVTRTEIATLGRTLRAATADVYGPALADDVARCVAPSAPVCADLASGALLYERARRLYDDDRFADAAPLLAASDRLRRAGSRLELRARFQWTITQYYGRQIAVVRESLASILHEARRLGFLSLEGRARWIQGLSRPMPTGFRERMADYEGALAAFTRAGEQPNVAAVHVLLAETSQLYGDFGEAWSHRRHAFDGLLQTRDPRRWHAAMLEATRALRQQGIFRAARVFDDALLAFALEWDRPTALTEAYAERARVDFELGRGDRGAGAATQAVQALASVRDPAMQDRLAPFVLSAVADVLQLTAPDQAVQIADQAAGLFRSIGARHHLLAMARIGAIARVQQGQRQEARRELAAAIDELEAQRRALDREAVRISHTADAWALFKDMIALSLPDDTDTAFEYAERGRGRDVLDALASGGEPRLTLARVRAALPPQVVLVSYVVTEQEILTWTVGHGRSAFARTPMSRLQLRQQVTAFQTALQTVERAGVVEEMAGDLYRLLIDPGQEFLSSASTIVIVPDDVLSAVPFAALMNPATGRFLASQYRVTVAPSVDIFLRLSARLARWPPTPASAAIVCHGSRSPVALRVDREIQAMSAAYREATVMTPAEGTVESTAELVRALGRYNVVHIAGHGVANLDAPDQSHLTIGDGNPARDVRLFSADLERGEYEKTRVFVLAACRTAVGKVVRGSAALSLARPFLKRGVPAVVASLWDVDDRATGELFAFFHEEMQKDGDPSGALWRAQRRMMTAEDRLLKAPASWAGFVAIGGIR